MSQQSDKGAPIESLERGLSQIRELLRDAVEKKIDDHEKTTVVVSDAIDLTNDIQDAIDTHKHRKTSKLTGFVESFTQRGPNRILLNRIDSVKSSLKKDTEAGSVGQHRPDKEEAEWHHKVMSTDVEKDVVVGFDQHTRTIIDQLKGGSPSLDVVSIVGMGGLGKTTLARLIYRRVKSDFDCSAWVYVSNDPRERDIWLSLLRRWISEPEFEEAKSKQVNELKNMVEKHLEDKRYLIVLDDIWKRHVWDQVRDAFPQNENRSRILITSRIKSVASYASPTPPYCLPFLHNEDSWKLLCYKLWNGEQCPPGLEPLGKQIVAGCEGLPLSIVVLSGLLKTKEKSAREWSMIAGNVNWYLTRDESPIKNILKLSYNNLPQRLKICFLYLALFPPDYEIPFRQLVHLWVAEGLCYPISETTNPEDVAEDYLKELDDHSLIQVAMNRTDDGVKACRIHDLLRHIGVDEGKRLKLFEIYTGIEMFDDDISRRISVHCSAPLYISSSTRDHSVLRSFLCFGPQYDFDESQWKWILKNFLLLRVLDLGQVQGMSSIPKKTEKLIHLRYLRIDTKGPPLNIDAICNLWNLETLDLRNSRIRALPKGIHKLQQLRHLYMCGDVILPKPSGAVDEVMKNLQTLSTVALDEENVSQLEKQTFPHLRKLGFHSSHKEFNLELLPRLQCLSGLITMKIINVLGFATSGNRFPPNLAKISLVNVTNFEGRYMKALGSLPNLRILKLSEMKNSTELKCAAGDFPALQVFQMKSLSCGNWELAQRAMPQLRSFVLEKCANMTSLPDELWSLPNLKEVVVVWPSRKMNDNLQELKIKEGDRLKIYHPPASQEKQTSSD